MSKLDPCGSFPPKRNLKFRSADTELRVLEELKPRGTSRFFQEHSAQRKHWLLMALNSLGGIATTDAIGRVPGLRVGGKSAALYLSDLQRKRYVRQDAIIRIEGMPHVRWALTAAGATLLREA